MNRVSGKPRTARCRLLALAGLGLLVACQEEPQQKEIPPRPIKSYTVSQAAGGMVRRYSGIAEAAEKTALSFAVPGSIQELTVNVGDSVEAEQIIAKLDPEPFKLDVQAAISEVEKAQSALVTAEGDLERNRILFEKNLVTSAAIEKFQASRDSAVSTLNYARSRLAVAERNLASATLRAPYDGTVASKSVERFQEIGAGQPVIELNSTAGLLVTFSVPESAINRLAPGQSIATAFSAIGPETVSATITEIEAVASAGNAYTVKASLTEPPAGLRPGMTAQITIDAALDNSEAGYLVPLAALVPGGTDSNAAIFRFDEAAGVVRRIPIQTRGVKDNLIIVQEGLQPGDIIAAAGVSFLQDGQAVRLLEQ